MSIIIKIILIILEGYNQPLRAVRLFWKILLKLKIVGENRPWEHLFKGKQMEQAEQDKSGYPVYIK